MAAAAEPTMINVPSRVLVSRVLTIPAGAMLAKDFSVLFRVVLP